MKDFYKILELNFGANEVEVKKAYRTLAQKYHPDKNFGQRTYEEKLKEVNEAYTFLSDSRRKINYDIQYKNKFNTQYSSSTNSTNSSNSNSRNSEKSNNNTNTKTENDNYATNMNQDSNAIKKNIFSNKPLVFLFIALSISIGILIYKWNDITYYFEEKAEKEKHEQLIASVSETKKFNENSLPSLRIPRITLETRWKEDLMYYKFALLNNKAENLNKYNSKKIDSLSSDHYFETRVKTINKIIIEFMDKDGFNIYNLNVSISEMTQLLDNNGIINGYSINSHISIKPELYKDFKSCEITYTSN